MREVGGDKSETEKRMPLLEVRKWQLARYERLADRGWRGIILYR